MHREDARSDALRRLGAEVTEVDLFDAASISRCLAGADRAYYVPPWHPYMLDSAAAFASAAGVSTLESVVWLSQWLASPSHPSPATRQHALIDRMLADLAGIGRPS